MIQAIDIKVKFTINFIIALHKLLINLSNQVDNVVLLVKSYQMKKKCFHAHYLRQ